MVKQLCLILIVAGCEPTWWCSGALDPVSLVSKAKKELNAAVATSVLQHVVISCQPCIGIKEEGNPRRGYGYGSSTIEAGAPSGDQSKPKQRERNMIRDNREYRYNIGNIKNRII